MQPTFLLTTHILLLSSAAAAMTRSSSSSTTAVAVSEFRKIQHEIFQEYHTLLGSKLIESFTEAQAQYPWGLSTETIETEKCSDPVPSHDQLQVLQQQNNKFTAQMQDDMTTNLSSLTLFLKSSSTSSQESMTEHEQQEFTNTVTSLLMCAAVDTFKGISGPYTPSYMLILSRLLALKEEHSEEAAQLWLWSKVATSHLVSLEVQTWVSFALEKIEAHQDAILAFVDKIGNLATKRRRQD